MAFLFLNLQLFPPLKILKSLLQTKGWQSAVLKVQIHAGGRGKAGGVKFAQGRKKF